jgi:hypothetical protein
MNDERFEQLMRDAAVTYRRPPEPPLDDMWSSIEAEAFHGTSARESGRRFHPARIWRSQWLKVAAALVIGVGLGRVWTNAAVKAAQVGVQIAGVDGSSSTVPGERVNEPYELATTKYLDQTAALLIALPGEMRGGRADQRFTARAGELLLTTRLLLDSPAASEDPSLRNLLEDLELVLAQVVRLHDERGRTEMELINQALEQRDVLPRLRSAVADISADD